MALTELVAFCGITVMMRPRRSSEPAGKSGAGCARAGSGTASVPRRRRVEGFIGVILSNDAPLMRCDVHRPGGQMEWH